MTNPTSSDRILGSLQAINGKGAIRIEDRFDTDIDDLWSAVTDPARLARWLGEIDGDLRIGGAFQAHFFASDWSGTGRVEECHKPNRLTITTTGTDEPDEHVIELTLTADGQATILVIEERGMPLALVAAYGAGTQVHAEDLAAYLAGRDRADARTRWQELIPAYQALTVAVPGERDDASGC